ncbi:MAG: 5'-methylthioadenosine/adenosylhomocysteine nucleosidase [Erysipelotrichaceae bacterium]
MIGIIGAMQKEIDEILKLMTNIKEASIHQTDMYIGTLGNVDVVLMLSGVGKVNASMNTTILLSNYDVEYIINIGTAGGLEPNENVLDIVISDYVVQHDYDTSLIDGESGIGLSFKADSELVKHATDILAATTINSNVYVGTIASGDQFIADIKQLEVIKKKFNKAKCVEMEAGSIAHVCAKFNIPFIVIRSLSDIVFNPSSHLDFNEYLMRASERSAKFTYDFINN